MRGLSHAAAGILEDDLHVAAQRGELGMVELDDVAALEPDFARGRLDHPADVQRPVSICRAAGFSDQAQRFAGGKLELT